MADEYEDEETEDEELVRGKLTMARRVELIERDTRAQARSLTGIVTTLGKGFSPEQMQQFRTLLREELADAGLRIDGPEHVDDAREDFRFLRRLRVGWGGAVDKIGNGVLIAVIAVALSIIGAGFWTWINSGVNK